MTKMLLVSHEASLTGAPRVAAEILRATKGIVDERVVVIRWPGPLGAELAAAADRAISEPLRRTRVLLRRFRRTRRSAVSLEEAMARRILRRERPDLVYLNTVKSACYVRPALELGCRVILHSHEMDDLASATLARYRLDGSYDQVRLVACSGAAADCLRSITGQDEISVVPEVVDGDRVRRLAGAGPDAGDGLPEESGLVVACGTADFRKGTDLWLRVARLVKDEMGSDCPLFVWVGESSRGGYEELCAELEIEDRVRFVGPTSNPHPIMARADLFTMPSRQDAFPLVVLEAMSLETPIVAFDVGGIREQVGDSALLVPPGDVGAMADGVVRMMGDGDTRRRLASEARRRVDDLYSLQQFDQKVASLVRTELLGGDTA